ncbi:conserved hypothetical protein [Prochlorococcus marinus str. MIT 9515]|uniref:CheY-like domain containing protein n=1 Tax=Prochlorococcus marinus (strain MIT 9515) TaxID=167542 RepID=A2BW34_PROM5|nr:DUF3685 domain-containing protein [Prochlorococcus marinus]ABM71995.1 conserved hypothetical protein [Prochlorococcus marinus str. MIT 9515]
MELIKKKSLLIIAPSLIAESLSLKLTSLDNNLNISLNGNTKGLNPDLIIWNILNYQSEELIRLELLRLKERFDESKILVIFSGELINKAKVAPTLNSEGLLLNPSVDKVLESINIIIEGGRVFDLCNNPSVKNNKVKELTFNQKLLSSGLKQIDTEINYIFKYVNSDSTPEFYKFILKGRLRELITAKSFLIFLWGNSLELYSEAIYTENKINFENKDNNTIFIKNKNSIEIWDLILKRLSKRYNTTNFDVDFNNSSIILSGMKKEFISRLICKMLDELDNLIKNIKENYKEKDYKEDFNSLIEELRLNTISNITESYFRVKKDGESISLNEYIHKEVTCNEIDRESHDSIMFIDPIIKNEPIDYDGKFLPLYETESFIVLENIISNWIIRNCNLLASEVFNICSSWPELRTILINPQLQSTRSFERFRNNINNYNRWHENIYMPIYLYESKREYIDIIDSKFTRYYKNENREKELENLEWFQKQVTLLVEIRDAIAPQLEIAVKYIGNLLVSFLTKVVGKAIGLVGKGILQGLGRSSTK